MAKIVSWDDTFHSQLIVGAWFTRAEIAGLDPEALVKSVSAQLINKLAEVRLEFLAKQEIEAIIVRAD